VIEIIAEVASFRVRAVFLNIPKNKDLIDIRIFQQVFKKTIRKDIPSVQNHGLDIHDRIKAQENPFSSFAEAAKPALAPPETTTALAEAEKGAMSAYEGIKFMPEAIGLSRLANKIKAVDQYYPMYERIDAGEKITRAEATAAKLDFAPIQRYQSASPEERLAMREKEQQYIVENQLINFVQIYINFSVSLFIL